MKLTLVIFAVCVSVAFTATVEEDGPNKACACTMDFKPVCGYDRETYGNDCMRKCNNVRMLHEGECEDEDECVCTREYQPVCGDDGKTYPNDCSRECAGAINVNEGPCDSK